MTRKKKLLSEECVPFYHRFPVCASLQLSRIRVEYNARAIFKTVSYLSNNGAQDKRNSIHLYFLRKR